MPSLGEVFLLSFGPGICRKVASGLHLAFENRELRDICLSETASAQAYGQDVSDVLRARLADMIAAETLAEVVAGRLRNDPDDAPGTFLLSLGGGALLRFRANHPRTGLMGKASLNESRISRVMLISVETSHARPG